MKIELLKSQNIELSKLETNKGQIEGLPKNPRHIKSEKYEKLKKSIEDNPEMLGMREVLVYPHGSKYVIIGGNMRFQACKELGFKEVPCKVLDKDMTAEQLRAITIKDNVGFGEHDWELLANEWDSVELEEWGLEVPNFETEETILEAEEDDYEEPDNLKVDVVLGDLIEFECTDGRVHRLICGDSTDSDTVAKLMNGEKADMVFTDPPYGMNFQSNFREKTPQFSKIENDDKILDISPILLLNTKTNSAIYLCTRWDVYPIWYNQMNESFDIKNCVVWYKKGGGLGDLKNSYSPNHEFIIVGHNGKAELKGKRESDVWEIGRDSVNEYQHPTQKPIQLSSFAIINHSENNNIILDLFIGSGSTMVAAHQLKRKCYGMELEPKYCQVIIDRMTKLDNTIKVKINGKDYATT